MLTVTRANVNDINEVIIHYKTVINQIQFNKYNPGWKFGIHPTKNHIIKAIESGELYVGKINDKIVASLIMDNNSLEANDNVTWSQMFKSSEISFIHMVAVNQDYKKRGFAKIMLEYAFNLARNNSIKTIRLSLNRTNLIVEKLYIKMGFKCRGIQEVYIENRGYITFNLYEKIL